MKTRPWFEHGTARSAIVCSTTELPSHCPTSGSIHLYQGQHSSLVTRRVVDAYLFYSDDMADVEMKDAKSKADAKDDVAAPPLSPVSEIKSNVTLIERAVSTLEPRFTIRVLRSLTALRKRLDDKALCDAISEIYPQGSRVLIF